MRVALTMRVVQAPDYSEPRDAISHDWIGWLEERGLTPVLIPNSLKDPRRHLFDLGAEAVVLTGGNDLVPRPDVKDSTAVERTETEVALLAAALDAHIPVLGTCRGLHVINNQFGGTVAPDITGGSVDHVASVHAVALEGAFAAVAGRNRIETNSFHRQGVTTDRLAPALRAFATCEGDGLIEGFFHPDAAVLAMQWHPERANPAAAFDDDLIGRFLEHGAFWRR